MKKIYFAIFLLALLGSFPSQGQNLLPNGSFESGSATTFSNWWTQVGGGGSGSFSVETSDVQEGSRAMKVDISQAGSAAYSIQAVNEPWASVAGKEYTLTFYAKAETAGSVLRVVQQEATYAQQEFLLTTSWAKYTWTFTAQEDNLRLRLNFPQAGTFYIDNMLIPPSGPIQELLKNGSFETGTGDSFSNWWYSEGGTSNITAETTDVQDGSRALKVDITSPGSNAWDIQAVNDTWPSQAGKEYTLSFYAKAAVAGSQFKLILQNSTYAERIITLSENWQKYQWTFTAQEAGLQVKLHFPNAGTFYLDNFSVPGTISEEPEPEPYTPSGPPIATGQPKFLGGVYSASQLPNFTAYWNQVVPENAGKWGAVEATRDVMNWTELDAAYKLAKDNNFPFRMHVLIWGNQQPTWLDNLSSAEQLEEIEEWYAAVANRYPDIDFLEVVNEPTNDPPVKRNADDQGSGNYIEALGGTGTTGWDWVINSFKLARKHFPETKLMLNDYSVENVPANTERYLGIIQLLQQEDLIDAIGIQGHAFSTRGTPAATLKSNLDLLASTGLPIYITELDIDGTTDAVQLAEYQRVFPVFWEHPAVKGITLWGYRPGHWRTSQGAYLVHANGAERAAMKWLIEYVQENENLNAPVITPGQEFQLSEAADNNSVAGTVVATDADGPTTFQGWQITGGSGASIFTIDAATGEIIVTDNTLLDFETTTAYTLTVRVHDGFNTSEDEEVSLQITNANDIAPVVTASQSFAIDALPETLAATDGDDANQPGFTTFQDWQITAGDGFSIFAIEAGTGKISIERADLIDFSKSSYTIMVTVGDGVNTSAEEAVTILIPDKIFVCHKQGNLIQVSKMAVPAHVRHGDSIGACTEDAIADTQANGGGMITVYPNPAKEKITVSLGANEYKVWNIEILDLNSGSVLIQKPVFETHTIEIQCHTLQPGIYLLRMQGEQEVRQRIVIE